MLLARVAVPVPLGKAFSYAVPQALHDQLTAGSRVLVEFGRRRVLGVVLDVAERELDVPLDKLKDVAAVVDPEPVLPAELLSFLVELARYYLAPVGEVMRLALPAVERTAKARLDQQGELGGLDVASVGRLVQVATAVPGASVKARGQAQAILAHLLEAGATPVSELSEHWKNARTAIKRLQAQGAVVIEQQQRTVDPFFATPVERDTAPTPTAPQEDAVLAIAAALETKERAAFLLQGVTGSGKTEVYLRVTERVLNAGGGAIVLVPEIALTPQLVSRFRARLGDRIAVLHSGLTDNERHAMWKALRSGELRVAVGARSALFAPVQSLALVIVDEEHDGSFKQEEGVRYHARDMALLRAHRAGAVCVLGTATPAVSTEALVRDGRITRLRLPERAHHAAALPKVELVDLRRTGAGVAGHRLLTLPLFRALERVLSEKQQAILFLNRRGFAPSLVCESCGQIVQCPNCAVALTLHRSAGARLICHYCDYQTPQLAACPSCKEPRLSEEGAGTERIEAALATAFPSARVARLDRDVAAGAKSERVLDKMRNHEIDVLVGTQMVTKGHDLPNVTLVGVLNADAALSLPDFRAAERTFHLLVQVAGRAGRGDAPGRVLIQTWQPDHPAVTLAAHHDVDAFLERELLDRRELRYPPYSRLALVRVDAVQEATARAAADHLAARARRALTAPEGMDLLGPVAAPLARLRNRYRFRFMLRAKDRAPLRAALLAVLRTKVDHRVRVGIDVDPMSML